MNNIQLIAFSSVPVRPVMCFVTPQCITRKTHFSVSHQWCLGKTTILEQQLYSLNKRHNCLYRCCSDMVVLPMSEQKVFSYYHSHQVKSSSIYEHHTHQAQTAITELMVGWLVLLFRSRSTNFQLLINQYSWSPLMSPVSHNCSKSSLMRFLFLVLLFQFLSFWISSDWWTVTDVDQTVL